MREKPFDIFDPKNIEAALKPPQWPKCRKEYVEISKGYKIYFEDIKTRENLLGWAVHLLQKADMKREVVLDFIIMVGEEKGWKVFECE